MRRFTTLNGRLAELGSDQIFLMARVPTWPRLEESKMFLYCAPYSAALAQRPGFGANHKILPANFGIKALPGCNIAYRKGL